METLRRGNTLDQFAIAGPCVKRWEFGGIVLIILT